MTATAAAPAKPAKLPRDQDPRNPNFRLAALFDEGTLELITEDDGSGMLAAVGKVDGTHVVAFCSDSVRMCTTPERRPCGSGPPRRSMSTSSPVTERTTSGPVTKIRPSGPRITTSVSAGPYAAPPAAGPSTTEICGTLPEAWVITWKI